MVIPFVYGFLIVVKEAGFCVSTGGSSKLSV